MQVGRRYDYKWLDILFILPAPAWTLRAIELWEALRNLLQLPIRSLNPVYTLSAPSG